MPESGDSWQELEGWHEDVVLGLPCIYHRSEPHRLLPMPVAEIEMKSLWVRNRNYFSDTYIRNSVFVLKGHWIYIYLHGLSQEASGLREIITW